MANAADIMARIRSHGANVMIDRGKLTIVNGKKLPTGALDYIKAHAKDISDFLCAEAEFEERAAIIEYDGGLTRPVAEYLTKLLMRSPPDGANPADWSWFVGHAAKVIDEAPLRRAA